MQLRPPLDADTDDVLAFVVAALPAAPATVLEVGAGDGRLAARLADRGFRVKAIDVDEEQVAAARARGVDAHGVDFFAFGGARFDAVIFTRSFHHLAPLPDAVAHARELLAAGGTLVLDEFAVDEVDLATAAWFYDLHALLREAGALSPHEHRHHHHHDGHDRPEPTNPLDRWREHHAHEPPLHGARAMVDGLTRVFGELEIERRPYLHRYFADRLDADTRGARLFACMRELEAERIALGLLVPVGLRITARAGA